MPVREVEALPTEDWTETECRLWDAFQQGEELNLGSFDPKRPDVVRPTEWESGRTIRAQTLTAILLRGADEPMGGPPRLRLSGARIVGELDVGCGEVAPFLFRNCVFDSPPMLNDARVPFVGFTNCLMPSLLAARVAIDGPVWLCKSHFLGPINLEGATIVGGIDADAIVVKGSNERGLILSGAKIGGNLDLIGAEISAGDDAIAGYQIAVNGSVNCSRGFSVTGGIYLGGAQIQGRLILRGAKIVKDRKTALDLDHASVGLGILARDLNCIGGIRMHHAKVGCQVEFSRSTIKSPRGEALAADHLIVDGSVLLNGGFKCEGAIDLHAAVIECTLNMYEAHLEVRNEYALRADGMRVGKDIRALNMRVGGGLCLTAVKVEGSVLLNESKISRPGRIALNLGRAAIGGDLVGSHRVCVDGAFSIADANVGISVQINGIRIDHPDGKALDGAGLIVRGDLIGDQIEVKGLLDLASGEIGGDLRLADARLEGVPTKQSSVGVAVDQRRGSRWRGTALRCRAATVGGDVDLRGAVIAESLDLRAARVSGSILLVGTRLEADETSAIAAEKLTAHTLRLQPKGAPRSRVSLEGARLELLADGPTSWPSSAPISIEDFQYVRLESELSLRDRLTWLRKATGRYSPQPYEHLASCLVAAGRENEARRIRFDKIRRSYESRGVLTRSWGKLQEWTVGFGYRPFRAVLIIIALWVGGAAWFWQGVTPCSRGRNSYTGLCPVNTNNHPAWDPWLYSLDLLVPIIDIGHAKAWDPAGISKMVMIFLIMCGWLFTTTIVAAVTRALRG